jgi:hypothetical protein
MTDAPKKRTPLRGGPVAPRIVKKTLALVREPMTPEPIFNSTILIQATLPQRDPGQVPEWRRTNGNVTLSIIPMRDGPDGKRIFAYPYGSFPRLILLWATTEVGRLKERGEDSRTLHLGNSLSEFMGKLHISDGGKQYKDLNKQIRRLFGAIVTYQELGANYSKEATLPVADLRAFWWDEKDPEQNVLFDSTVRLSELFHMYLSRKTYPMDINIVKVIKGSSIALDLYAWLCHRIYGLDEPLELTWGSIAKQIGADFGRGRAFAEKARKHLKVIQALWPTLRLEEERGSRTSKGRLVLYPSPPSVPAKALR